jgi:hypothetical protein
MPQPGNCHKLPESGTPQNGFSLERNGRFVSFKERTAHFNKFREPRVRPVASEAPTG